MMEETVDADVSNFLNNNICMESLMSYKNQFKNEKKEVLSPNMIVAIELLSILRVCGASLGLYDKIICWVENRILHSLLEALPTRDKCGKSNGETIQLTMYGTKTEKSNIAIY